MESNLLTLDGKIEAIIANNGATAKAPLKRFRNMGIIKRYSKYIPVVGVDALPKAKELIKEGVMTVMLSRSTCSCKCNLYHRNESRLWRLSSQWYKL